MKHALLIIALPLALAISVNGFSQTPQDTAALPISINAAHADRGTNVVIILPTAETTKEACDRIGKYAKDVFKNRGMFLFLDDTAALKEDLSGYTIITYGTPSGNLWVRQNLKGLPVAITNAEIVVADREFKGTNLRFISVWFNPANPAKPWIIYTAQNETDVVGINSVFHGWKQFHVAKGTELLHSGYYSHRNGAWVVSDRPDFGLPALTRQQMYQDYDTFTNIVEQVFPLMEVNRQIYGVDVRKLLSDNRSQIATITQTGQFAELINRTIVACRGSHFWIGCQRNEDYQGFVDAEAYKLVEKYQVYLSSANKGNGIAIPLLYFQGDYYTLCDGVCGGVTYPKGLRVLACDGKTPDAMVNAVAQSGVSPGWDFLSWDYDRNKYYTTHSIPFPKSDSPLVMQLAQADGKLLTLKLTADKQGTWRMPQPDRQPLVALVNGNILYIKLPSMDKNLIPFYRKELLKYKGEPIQRVVVDIRNNSGGSDNTWSALLSLLLKQKLVLAYKWAVKKSDIMHRYAARDPHSFYESAKVEKISFLNNEEFKVTEEPRVISPDPESLNLACKIFVLSENIYSSAGGFMNICKDSDQLVSVGLPNGQILGQGGDPMAFSLPNSKITFSIEAILDLTDCQTARDTHHIDVEVRINPTLEQLLDYYNTGTDVPLEKRLNEHDPFFKKVLEMG
jgi:hypothetical protein